MSRKRLILICLPILCLGAGCRTLDVSPGFQSDWSPQGDRIWLGEQYWANRLHDWRLIDGHLECVVDRVAPMRTVHLLTARLGDQSAGFEMSVHTGLATSEGDLADSATGFLVGVGHGDMDYRSAAIASDGVLGHHFELLFAVCGQF